MVRVTPLAPRPLSIVDRVLVAPSYFMDTHLMMLMEVDLKELRARRRPSIRLSTLMNRFLVVDGAEDVVEAKSVSLLMHYMAPVLPDAAVQRDDPAELYQRHGHGDDMLDVMRQLLHEKAIYCKDW